MGPEGAAAGASNFNPKTRMASRSPSPSGGTPRTDLSGVRPPRFNNGWTKEQEELMAGWADVASCYRWMHDKCEKKNARSNLSITVPVIILSTLTGSANFMLQSVIPPDDKELQKYAQIAIGGVSIFTGILTTLGNFFRYAQSSEAHRVAGIAWGKFQRQIQVELALHPKERIDCMDYLKICRAELDRMIEQSPPIPDSIIAAFEREFKNLPTLKKPDIAHGMDHTKVFVDKDTRLRQMTVEATMLLQQKKKVLHTALLPEVDRRLDTRIQKTIQDLSGSVFQDLQAKIASLEAKLAEKEESQKVAQHARYRSFRRNSLTPPSAKNLPRGRPIIRRPPAANPQSPPRQAPPPLTPIPTTSQISQLIPGSNVLTPERLVQALQQVPVNPVVFPESDFNVGFHSDTEEPPAPAEPVAVVVEVVPEGSEMPAPSQPPESSEQAGEP